MFPDRYLEMYAREKDTFPDRDRALEGGMKE
jgi:hypothetical protein